jgi:hypothetical protein
MLMEGRQQRDSPHHTRAASVRPAAGLTDGQQRVGRPGEWDGEENREPLSGAHVCAFYESDEERLALLRSFVAEGLGGQDKVICINAAIVARAPLTPEELVGTDLQRHPAPGQLQISTALETYLRAGSFDPARVIAWLQRETRRAVADSFRALRVAVEMDWALRGAPGSEKLIEYEVLLDAFLRGRKCQVLCLYDGRRFGPAVLQHVLTTHPFVVVDGALRRNPYYRIAPTGFGTGPASVTLGRWLAELSGCGQASFP